MARFAFIKHLGLPWIHLEHLTSLSPANHCHIVIDSEI